MRQVVQGHFSDLTVMAHAACHDFFSDIAADTDVHAESMGRVLGHIAVLGPDDFVHQGFFTLAQDESVQIKIQRAQDHPWVFFG